MGTRILVIDNYDSFVFNLVQYLEQLGAECTVVRNDSVAANTADQFDGVLISPGPGTPQAAGISIEMIKYSAEVSKPLLGVCLGHQALAVAYGATVSRAPNYYMERHQIFLMMKVEFSQIFPRHLLQPDTTHLQLRKKLSQTN